MLVAGWTDPMTDWQDAEEHVDKAHELFQAGRLGEAEKLLRKALSVHPDRAEWHFNLGLTLEASGKFPDAAAAFADAARNNPRDPLPLLAAGVNRLRCDEPGPAVELLNKALRLDPNRLETLVHLIEANARMGDHDEAEVMFYRALQLDGEHAEAYANMGESLAERGQFAKAASCFTDALKLKPGLPRVAARLAYCTHKLGDSDKARKLYLKELRENPGDVDTLLDLGELLAETGRTAEAGEKFRRVLELEPKNTHALFALAGVALRQHRPRVAVKRLRRVLTLAPDFPEARRRLARVLLEQGDAEGARAELRRELAAMRGRVGGSDPPALRELGDLLLEANLTRHAASVFGALRRRTPLDALAHHSFGTACLMAGMTRAGVRAERRAVRLDRELLPAWHNLALAMMDLKRWRRARVFVERARRLAPSDRRIRRLVLTLRVRRAMALVGLGA